VPCRIALTLLLAVSVVGCANDERSNPVSTGPPTATDRATTSAGVITAPATPAATESTTSDPRKGGCGQTPVHSGNEVPPWGQVGASFLRFVATEEGNAVGFLFADPLRVAPRTDGRNNKILWVVREPRKGQDLLLDGKLGDISVNVTKPADSGPGEIYPSIVDVPTAGCWRFTLHWGPNTGHVDLLYET
jgi:hypothetical protein